MPSPLRVLLLDDRAEDAEVILHELRRAGFDPDWRRAETEADYLAHLDPALDIILADYTLPQFDAPRALQALQERGLDIPLIIVTGTISEQVAVECIKRGAADYLLKGRLARLGAAVTQAVEEYRVRAEERRLSREEEERRRQLEAVRAVTLEITRELDLATLLDLISRRAGELVGTRSGMIWLWDEAAQALIPRTWHGRGELIKDVRLALGEGVTGTVAQRREGLIVNDYSASPYAVPRVRDRIHVAAVLAEPLLYRDRLLGVITLDDGGTERRFTERDRETLALFAAQAAIAIENARLHDTALRHAQQLARLNEMTRKLTTILEPAVLSQGILEALVALFPGAAGNLWQQEAENGNHRLIATIGLRDPTAGVAQRLAAYEGLTGIACATRQPVMTRDIQRDPRFVNRAWAAAEGLASCIALPLLSRDKCLGALVLFTQTPHDFTEDEVEILQSFAAQAAIAIKNARLYEDSDRRACEATAIAEVGRVLSESLEIDRVLEVIVREVRRVMGAPCVGIMTLDEERQELFYVYGAGLSQERIAEVRLKVGEGLTGQSILQGVPVQSANLLQDPRYVPFATSEAEGLRSLLSAPLLARGRPLGAINVFRQDEHEFTAAEVQLLVRFADLAAVTLENAQLYRKVKDARDFLESIAANSTDSIVTTDIRGRLTYLSSGTEETVGYRAAELLGRPMSSLYRAGIQEARAIMRRLRAEGRIQNYETTLRTKDGRWVDVSMSMSLLRDAGGAIIATLGITRDISERKRAEVELQRLASFPRLNPNPVIEADLDGTITYLNPAAIARFPDLSAAGLRHPLLADLKTLAADPERSGKESHVSEVGIGPATYHCTTTWIPEIKRVRIYTVDITERRRAEGELRKLFRAVEQSPTSIVITDAAGHIEYVNPKFTQVTGYTFDEVRGQNSRILKSGKTSADEYRRLWQTITAGKEWRGEFHNRGKDGTLFWEAASISPIKNADGIITHFLGVKEDITERKRAEKELRRVHDELMAQRDRLRALADANLKVREEEAKRIAHALHDEAGQLVVSVHFALEEIIRDLPSGNRERFRDVKCLLRQIEEQLRRLAHELRPTILDDLGLRPALDFLAQGISERSGVQITVDGSTGGRLTAPVETAIYRIAQEALTNVARHAQATHATVILRREDGQIRLTIRDDGMGFDVTETLSRRGGRGLGLIGIQERLEALDGAFEVTSSPGRGTELRATVPLMDGNRRLKRQTRRPRGFPAREIRGSPDSPVSL